MKNHRGSSLTNLVQSLDCLLLIKKILLLFSLNKLSSCTQECLDEMERVSSSLTKILGSNPALGMHQR